MIINVLKVGSYFVEVGVDFIVRNHIQLPNEMTQKWSNEYISIRNIRQGSLELLMNNQLNAFIPLLCEFSIDKNGVEFIKATPTKGNSNLWLTTFTVMDGTLQQKCIVPNNSNPHSRIFSSAYNKHNPKMVEATAILQKGDIVKIGNTVSVFCPKHNPFLKVRHILK